MIQFQSDKKTLFVPKPGHRTPSEPKKRPREKLGEGRQGVVEFNRRMYRAEVTRASQEGVSIRFLDYPGQQVDYPAGENCRQYFVQGQL